jgi:hypothetical protein
MWEPRRLTPLSAFTACYRERFIFNCIIIIIIIIIIMYLLLWALYVLYKWSYLLQQLIASFSIFLQIETNFNYTFSFAKKTMH